jgi:hypothetical protein
MPDISRDRLGELLALTSYPDCWSDDHRADFIDSMAEQAGRTFDARFEVTLSVDIATWAAHSGVSAVPEAGDMFVEDLHPDRIADHLNAMRLPDGVGFNVTAADPKQPPPQDPDRDERGDWWTCSLHGGAVTQDCRCTGPQGTGDLEAAARALYKASCNPEPWRRLSEGGRDGFRRKARAAVEAYHGTHGPAAETIADGDIRARRWGTLSEAAELLDQLDAWREVVASGEAKGLPATSEQADVRQTLDRELAALVPALVSLVTGQNR